MKMRKGAAFGIIAVMVSAMLLASIPTVSASAELYGDANGDGKIDIRDVTYVGLIILGERPTNELANANHSHCQTEPPKFFNGLVKFDENLDLAPDLAESWDVSAGGKEYTFKLRRGVKWHDGREFTAEDVKFTYDLIIPIPGLVQSCML